MLFYFGNQKMKGGNFMKIFKRMFGISSSKFDTMCLTLIYLYSIFTLFSAIFSVDFLLQPTIHNFFAGFLVSFRIIKLGVKSN